MRASIFGLGYVGVVTSACLSRDGVHVVGVDVDPKKVALVAKGVSPIVEPGVNDLLSNSLREGRLEATTSAAEAVAATDVSLVCVGTPSGPDGRLDLTYVFDACREIGKAVRAAHKATHTVVLRSTVFPGTTRKCDALLHEYTNGCSLHVAFNPEFLREGNAVYDHDAPPFLIIGTDDPEAADAVRELNSGVTAHEMVCEPEVAEMAKLCCNAWHATKVVFANEVGRVAKHLGVEGRKVMEILCHDTKLNVSPAYLTPGFAYGGSCLPKDVRALAYFSESAGVSTPLLASLEPSNRAHVERAFDEVMATGCRRIGVLGVAFKPGTDDLRNSAGLALAEMLADAGCELAIYDSEVSAGRLARANGDPLEAASPLLAGLLVDSAQELLMRSDAVVVTHGAREFGRIIDHIAGEKPVIDVSEAFRTVRRSVLR